MMGLWASYETKIWEKFFFCILKISEERSWIRIRIRNRIRIQKSQIRIRGSGFGPHQNVTDPQHCLVEDWALIC
jgi:hypothetical protein